MNNTKLKKVEEPETEEIQDNSAPSQWDMVEEYLTKHYKVQKNVVANKVEFIELDSGKNEYVELNEYNIYRHLKKRNISFSINNLKAMLASDFVEEYNPFTDYFTGLEKYDPDMEPDWIDDLTGYFSIEKEHTEAFKTQLKKMLVRSVACALGVELNKHCFVLVHEKQNSGKSTFMRWLCPPALEEYIAENIQTDKDSLLAICTNFIINMDELATLSKLEINALKSVMSKDVYKGRLPYAARATKLRRRANFVGSTNNIEFLSDPTGNVRWICFKLTDKLNFDYKKDINIDRIWAQAYYLFKGGFKYQLTREEIKENEARNVEFMQRTIEQELIQQYFYPPTFPSNETHFKTTTQIKAVLDQHSFLHNKTTIRKVGIAVKILGYKQVSKRTNEEDYPIKGYYITEK